MCFLPSMILKKILVYSNLDPVHKRNSKEEMEEITIMELKAFIGLLLLAGLLGKSKIDLKCLWRRSPLESPIFKATMSRSRFQNIISCLRFDDRTTREERKRTDKFAAMREIWSYFQDGLTLVSFVPKPNKAVLLLSTKHHDNQVDHKTGKPMIILDYNKTKGAVDTVDQMCHKYTVKLFPVFLCFVLFSGKTRHKAMATVYFL